MKNIGIPYLCIYKPKRQVIPILEILDKDTIINEIIPHLPIEKRVLMEVIHLLFVEENKQQSNAWCDSYRSILNHFDTAISSWKGFNYLSFIIMGLKSLIQKSQDELHSQIEIIEKINLRKDNIPPVLCSPFIVICSLLSVICSLLSVICYLLSAHCPSRK